MTSVDLLGWKLLWLAAPLAAGAAGLSVWLYLPDTRSLSRGQAILLPALRAVAVAGLALLLLQPVLSRVSTRRRKAVLHVFVDDSESMSVVDRGMPPSRAVEIASGLGLLPRGAREDAPAGLIEKAAAAADSLHALSGALSRRLGREDAGGARASWRPELKACAAAFGEIKSSLSDVDLRGIPGEDAAAVRTASRIADEVSSFAPEEDERESAVLRRLAGLVRREIEASKRLPKELLRLQEALDRRLAEADRPGVREAIATVTGSSRLDLALRALTDEKTDLAGELGRSHALGVFALSDSARPIELGDGGEGAGELRDATGKGTDLASPVLEKVGEAGGAPVAGVLVFSDGRQTVPGSPVAAAAALGARGIPVYAIGVGSKSPPRDAAVTRLSGPAVVFKGDKISIEAFVRLAGIGQDVVPVSLCEGGRTLHTVEARVEDGGARATLEISADSPGIRRYLVRIPEYDNEPTYRNNARGISVKVVEDRMRVLLVAEYPRWEYRFLRNLVWRNREIEMDSVLFTDEDDGLTLPRERKEIMKSSVVILDDVPASRFAPDDWQALHDFVRRRGGTLVFISGPDHLPTEYVDGPLAELLPFRRGSPPVWRKRHPDEDPFRLVLAREGRTVPFMNLLDEDGSPVEWPKLPGFFEYVGADELAPGVKTLLRCTPEGEPVVVTRRYGLGKVIFFAFHETWRWRYKVADRYHGRFWGGLLRYAGEDPFPVKDRFVSLDADKTQYAPGEPVTVRARVVDEEGLPVERGDLLCCLEKQPEGEEAGARLPEGRPQAETVKRPLVVSLSGGGVYNAVFGDDARLEEGDYVITVESAGAEPLYREEPSERAELKVAVRAETEREFVDTTLAEDTLREMARVSLGRYFDLAEVREIPGVIGEGWNEQTTEARIELWSSYYVYAFILLVLTAEWLLRKRLGLS